MKMIVIQNPHLLKVMMKMIHILNLMKKISAMNFLLDDDQDDLNLVEFYPKDNDKRMNESRVHVLPSSIFTPHKLDLFSNHLFENSEQLDEDGYSDTSSETASIDSIKYIEDMEDDSEEEEDDENNQHSFIS